MDCCRGKKVTPNPGNSKAFSITSPCTDTGKPPNSRSSGARCCRSVNFRKFYKRGDIPIKVESARHIIWMVPIESLDYHYYLPLFFEGLSEVEFPYDLMSYQGAYEMISASDGCRVLPVLHRLILPMKNALCTRNCKVLSNVLKLLQLMIMKENDIGVALVPYYRQLLGVVNMFKNKHAVNIGDSIDYQHKDNIGFIINETLEMMERCGGENAYINIKYMIPSYESCMQY